ncbi:SDR family NAD(P)-dependent oxidoreductase [Conexibacter stalactiti]|uniref:SDR family NAD(P)-dependent oxidoreductase n=1 Tax=Conexibacter stalactiti TaxID=1940611 RepID=A0ABU4HPK8_9ACTN|nr:SDR family NAD(P)-dependent oxidoreductase [Conexibacter stalactiti]MDW5595226.1 SDR family NAD(P)-dependent oxidoreductase [Conexibacter stalactiti]MEC5035868.1 SDR family NAD(P)-dependent oxidoreductase [Conexibacter stalactiti]
MTDPSTDLRDKVALVTGGASGIGRLTALALAEAGAEVVVADIDGDGAERVAREIGGHALATDVSDLDANHAMVAFTQEHAGGLDLVFLNAGVTSDTMIGEGFDLARYRRAMGVNLDGVVFGTQAALPALKARGGGAIVATASLAGLTAVPLDAIYAANKHAVVGLTRSLGPLLAADGIRFNAVCPTFAETPLIAHVREGLRGAGFELLDPQIVADAALRLFAGRESGECWFVQIGREPAPFQFRNIPGPRTAPAEEEVAP